MEKISEPPIPQRKVGNGIVSTQFSRVLTINIISLFLKSKRKNKEKNFFSGNTPER
jgi:hypothetical protein